MSFRPINVLEHQVVQLPPHLDNDRTKAKLFRAGQTEIGPAFKLDRRGLVASGLIGLVSTQRVQVQILPKIYASDENATSLGLQYLQAMFPQAMARRFGLKQAFSSKTSDRLLDFVLDFFLRRLTQMLEWDYPRAYFEVSEIRDSLTGRVDLNQLARRPPGTMRGIQVRHAPLHSDNNTSRLCRAVIGEAINRAHDARIIWRAKNILISLEDVTSLPLSRELIERAILERRDDEWDVLITFANLLIEQNTSSPWQAGDTLGMGVMFRLEHLFEESVRSALRRGIKRVCGGSVEKRGLGTLLETVSGDKLLTLKPDLFIKMQKNRLVGDVKWKRLKDYRNPKPNESDIYQLLTYARQAKVNKCALVYPSSVRIPDVVHSTAYTSFSKDVHVGIIQVDALQLAEINPEKRKNAEDKLAHSFIKF